MVKNEHPAPICSRLPDQRLPLSERIEETKTKPNFVFRISWSLSSLLMLVVVVLGMLLLSQRQLLNLFQALYKPASCKVTSKFVSTFQQMLTTNKGITLGGDGYFVPLILDNGKLLCRRTHHKKISEFRVKYFINMVRMGLNNQTTNDSRKNNIIEGGLPILFTEGDNNYCRVVDEEDLYHFPRLSWSILSPKHKFRCQTIGVPSIQAWKIFHQRYKQQSDWVKKFQQNEQHYPWSSKKNLAVWRGSTTNEPQYQNSSLHDTPRGQLVKRSMDCPELIDAAFVNISKQFKEEKEKWEKETKMAKRMKMEDMMKYKATIDIDGNNWSSRFGMLLCMNSVVIKIDPNYIEYFYKDLQPMVHYIPATLENITQAVQYAIDKNNEQKVQSMIKAANSWCQKTMIESVFVKDALTQLDAYQNALEEMDDENWREEWLDVKNRFTESKMNDLVDCDV